MSNKRHTNARLQLTQSETLREAAIKWVAIDDPARGCSGGNGVPCLQPTTKHRNVIHSFWNQHLHSLPAHFYLVSSRTNPFTVRTKQEVCVVYSSYALNLSDFFHCHIQQFSPAPKWLTSKSSAFKVCAALIPKCHRRSNFFH